MLLNCSRFLRNTSQQSAQSRIVARKLVTARPANQPLKETRDWAALITLCTVQLWTVFPNAVWSLSVKFSLPHRDRLRRLPMLSLSVKISVLQAILEWKLCLMMSKMKILLSRCGRTKLLWRCRSTSKPKTIGDHRSSVMSRSSHRPVRSLLRCRQSCTARRTLERTCLRASRDSLIRWMKRCKQKGTKVIWRSKWPIFRSKWPKSKTRLALAFKEPTRSMQRCPQAWPCSRVSRGKPRLTNYEPWKA
mmetsp:Transcript_19093/g.48379  ORF Transcript_19093/g.48379 Transcript_19093/m.48379 type:complete len:248 (-) Transcript_19093:974-1717(-)